MPDEPNNETPQTPSEPAETPAAPPEGADPWADPDKARKEIEKLRRENAAARTKAKDRDDLASKVAEFERAQMTEQERAAKELTQAREYAERLRSRAVRSEVRALAAEGFADPDDAAAFLDLDAYVDEAGDVDSDRIKADLADLLERKPHLGRPEVARRPAPDLTQGSSGNGRPSSEPRDVFAAWVNKALQ